MDTIIESAADRKDLSVTKLVTENLNCDPIIVPSNSENFRTVLFGNSGLSVHFAKEVNVFNFIPEDSLHYEESNSVKHASMLAASFYSFYNFLNNPEQVNQAGISENQITSMAAITNPDMINALKNLFSRSNTEGMVSVDEKMGNIEIDLQKFKALQKEDPLIQYLGRISERARNIQVTYKKSVG